MSDILDFLTGGVFTTLKDLVINIVKWIIRFGVNLIKILLSPLLDKFFSLLPGFDIFLHYIDFIFDYITPYVNYFFDLTFISSPVLTYLFGSIIFRITIRSGSYLIKVLIKWYHKLVP